MEQVRFARAHFGTYDVIDFVVVLIGYSLSGERTLEKYYERLRPFATPFMVLFGRNELPSRYALSRYLSAIDQPTVEALRHLFEEDLLSRPLTQAQTQGVGLRDRCGELWQVFDGDGTRQVARQRALPQTLDLPKPHRRMDAGLSLLDTPDANVVKSFVRVPPSCSHTRGSGSRHSEEQATEIIVEICCG